MNAVGAALIMLACFAVGIIKAHSLSELDKTYSALIAVLMLLKSEITTLSSPLDAAIGRACEAAAGETERFLSQVSRNFTDLGEDTFCTIWCRAALDNLQSVSRRALSAVKSLGASLGRYDSTVQGAAIDRCINEIVIEQQALREALGADKRMYVGIGGAVGLIIAIMLV